MTLEQFLAIYRFNFREHNVGNGSYVIITEVHRRIGNAVVDGVKTSFDINETNDWVSDSQSPISLNPLDWPTIIEKAKRFQLDYFARRVPITDFLPLNTETDISNLG